MSSPEVSSPMPNEDTVKSVGTLFDLIEKTFLTIVDEGIGTVLHLPKAVLEFITVLLNVPEFKFTSLRDTIIAIIVVLAGYGLANLLLASRRANANEHTIPFFGLLRQAGYDLLGLFFL